MRAIVALLVWVLVRGSAFGKPVDIPWQPSNDKSHEIAVRYQPLSDGSGTVAKLLLRRVGTERPTDNVALEVDAEDPRNGVSVEWSPDSRLLAVNIEVGQLRSFSVYRVTSGRLKILPELPLPKGLQPEHRKSRGGPAFQEWIDGSHFKVFDSSTETEFTYRVTKDGKLQSTQANAEKP